MSGQPERVYALEQLTRARAVILKESAELLADRGNCECAGTADERFRRLRRKKRKPYDFHHTGY